MHALVPHTAAAAVEAERALAGAILYDSRTVFREIADASLTPADFTDPHARAVFLWASERAAAGHPADLALATDALRGQVEAGELEKLVDACATSAHSAHYAGEVARARDRRNLLALAARLTATAGKPDHAAAVLADEMAVAVEDVRRALAAPAALLPVSAAAWLANEPPPPNYAVDGVFEIGDRVLLVAPSKCRKSFAAIQLAACVAAGKPFLGLPVPAPRRVLVANLENRAEWQTRRLQTMCRTLGISAADLGTPCRLATMTGRGYAVSFADIGRAAADFCAEVVIVDPLYAVADAGEEMDEGQRKIMLASVARIAAAGRAVVLVQHDPKGPAGDRDTRDRGSGRNTINRAVDCTLALTPYGDAREPDADALAVLSILARNAPPRPDVTIRFSDGAITLDPDRAPVKATSRGRGMDRPARDLDTLRDAALALVARPVSPGELKHALRAKLRLSKGDAEDLLNICTGAGGPLVRWTCGTFPQTWLVGTLDQRDKWQRQSLPSLSSLSSQRTPRTPSPVLSSRPLIGAGRQAGRQAG